MTPDINSPDHPNYFRQARERLEKASVDAETMNDIFDLMHLLYVQGY